MTYKVVYSIFAALSGNKVVRVALWAVYQPIIFNSGSVTLADMQAADMAAAGLDASLLSAPLEMKICIFGSGDEEDENEDESKAPRANQDKVTVRGGFQRSTAIASSDDEIDSE